MSQMKIPACAAQYCTDVPLIDDLVVEDKEEFSVTLKKGHNQGLNERIILINTEISCVIIDSDSKSLPIVVIGHIFNLNSMWCVFLASVVFYLKLLRFPLSIVPYGHKSVLPHYTQDVLEHMCQYH